MKQSNTWLVLVAVLVAGAPLRGAACDLCAIYTATQLRENRVGVHLGVAEQFSSLNTLQRHGESVDNPAGERLNSSITQFLLGYNFLPRFGVQLNLPLIARVYRRQGAGGIANGDETGIGDLSLLGNVVAYRDVTERSVIRLSLLGGLKFPSGNSRRIAEELAAGHGGRGPDPHGRFRAHQDAEHGGEVESGIHGHDLALGTGSLDGIIGAQLFASWQRLFVSGTVQYLVRTEGDFRYEHANDLIWRAGPGAFVWLTDACSLGVQGVLSGESKGTDSLAGVTVGDTGITAVYAGPGMAFTWGAALGADLALDVPVVQHTSGLQIVPDYRLRGGMTWHF